MKRLRQTILSTFQLMDNRQVVMDNIVNDARAIMTSVNPETQSVNNSVDEPQGTESAPRSQDSHIAVEATPAIVRDTRAVQPEDIAPQHDERLANDIRNLLQEEQNTLIARVRSLPHNLSTWHRPDEDDRTHHQRLLRLARNAIDSEQRAMNGVQPPRLDWRHRQAPAPQEPHRPPLRAPSPTAVPLNSGGMVSARLSSGGVGTQEEAVCEVWVKACLLTQTRVLVTGGRFSIVLDVTRKVRNRRMEDEWRMTVSVKTLRRVVIDLDIIWKD